MADLILDESVYRVAVATIANGASLSGAIDLGGADKISINMPADWTAANLTFQASDHLTGTYHNVYDSAGNELTVTAAEDRFLVDLPELSGIRYLKIRSGTSGSAVNQGAERKLQVVCKR